ncbi:MULTISPECIES: hypothetical protein [unclassified Acidisoma]|jgi:hypothetical protein|uniref:hypothetical protein n=1 Tax=unclassified Acidisoma TaxID=2634065 RepID=UPI00131E3DE3|nr:MULTISPECIES: hypothetical protein [unclassified Acidisoma]
MTPDENATSAQHPEELKATVELRITDHVTLRTTARATPAGLIGIALILSAILIPVMWGVRSRRLGR